MAYFTKKRKPSAAGRFYPATMEEIKTMVEGLYEREKKFIDISLAEKNIIGAIVPHAGYQYSGYQAVHFFEIIRNCKTHYDTIIIINPNHTTYGEPVSLDSNKYWITPIDEVEIDQDFIKILDFPSNISDQENEHSGAVMLPFLQLMLDYKFRILPITISHQNYYNARKLAEAIYSANSKLNKKVLIIASSDFSHHLPVKAGKKLDDKVVKEIIGFNSKNVEQTVNKYNISVCGFGPIMTLVEYSKLVSSNPNAVVLKSGHSGEVHPSPLVVNYISILFSC